MTWWQAILLGTLQGITEFLPISSSGHLVLAQHFLHFPDEAGAAALFFDGMLHLGTTLAVLCYFRQGLLYPPPTESSEPPPARPPWRHLFRLAVLVTLATLPAALVTVLASDHIQESFKRPVPVAVCFLVLGGILFLSDYLRAGRTAFAAIRWWQALLIGCGQAGSAVFRGLSRSGMTITVALGVGLQRDTAVRFSLLMSIVASLGLGGLGIVKALLDPKVSHWLTAEFLALTLLGTTVSGVVGYLSIAPLIRLVRAARLWWFSIYLWLVGGVVLALHFAGY